MTGNRADWIPLRPRKEDRMSVPDRFRQNTASPLPAYLRTESRYCPGEFLASPDSFESSCRCSASAPAHSI